MADPTATTPPNVPPVDPGQEGNERPAPAPQGQPGSTHSMPSPRIAVHDDVAIPEGHRPRAPSHISAPATPQLHSPLRHHKRTPSAHREIKETLNAKSQYTSDDTDGTKLRINQYIIREEIGRGSYGAVHLATDQFGHEYAIKEFSKTRLRKRAQSNILKRPHGTRPGRFPPGKGMRSPWSTHMKQLDNQDAAEAKDSLFLIREEIAIMKKLDHGNLVSLIEVLDDPDEDSLWMVLEMCQKGVIMKMGLDEQAEPYSEEQCRHWFRDLILGIEYLHAQGIVHRDIKPDNLLLTDDDVLKIVDFGVSEMFEKSDDMMTAKSAGSPAFLPPELCVAKHGDISGRSADIWSMGVTLYCLRYGKLPFKKDNVLDMYDSIRSEEVPVPSDENPDFADLITKVLDKNSNTRIHMEDIRSHPWVTKGGTDPLLPKEDNTAHMVVPPNELEVSHAFTRKMSHMLAVMRAITKFKGLISQSRASTPDNRSPRIPKSLEIPDFVPEGSREPSPTPTQEQSATTTRPREKSTADQAAELIEARKAYLASKDHPTRHQSTQHRDDDRSQDATPTGPAIETRFLGIGTGGQDQPGTHESPAVVVSDSPTGIDFDVYDRAFADEVERIRAKPAEEKTGRSHRKTYMTRFVQEKEKYFGDESMIVEAGRNIPAMASQGVDKAHAKAADTLDRLGFAAHIKERSREYKREHAKGKGPEDIAQADKSDIDEKDTPDTSDAKKPGSHEAVQTVKEKSHKFANLVMGALHSASSKTSSGGSN